MGETLVDAGFLYPVIAGKLYVAQRGTEPYAGFYGPIGGKSEVFNPDDPLYIKDFPSTPHISYSDILVKARNKEFGHVSAVREFYEEVFQMKKVPWGEVVNLFKIGAITDSFNGKITNCQFYLATIERCDFSLSTRELKDIKPIMEICVDQLYPLAQASLFVLKKVLEKGLIKKIEPYLLISLQKQIPLFGVDKISEIMQNKATTIEELLKF